MDSVLLFARIKFAVKLTTFYEKKQKREIERDALLQIINYDFNINYHLSKFNGKKGRVEWKFGGIKSSNDYIFGRLGKVKGHISNIIDSKSKDFIKNETKEANVCNFLIDLKSHIIIYESKKNIGEKSPLRVIETAFNSFHRKAEKITIQPLTDRREIINRINDLEAITIIKLNLHPTNPDSTPSSDKMDAFINDLNADKVVLEITSDRGISLEGAEGIITSGLRLAEEGYGNARVTGRKKGSAEGEKLEIINSVHLPIRETDTLPERDNQIIQLFREKIADILRIYKQL